MAARKTEIMSLRTIDVVTLPGRRVVKDEAVAVLAESIREIGLQMPVTVRPDPDSSDYFLVAGAHRLAACKAAGLERIDAVVAEWDEMEARLWEISENLHRAELSAVERAEQIDEWRRLTLERNKPTDLANSVGRPSKGHKETAARLGVSHQTVRNSKTIAELPQVTRDQAREEGWSQTKLLNAARPAPQNRQTRPRACQ
jgi:ParB/RepB/Spo0J family partition protein